MAVAFVLGAGGFIGRAVVSALRDADLRVVEARRDGASAEGDGDVERIDLLADPATRLAERLRAVAPDVIVNCVGATTGSAERLLVANVRTVERLLEAAATARSGARLIHLGSAAEYGARPIGVPVTESDEPQPESDYGMTKLAATRLVVQTAAAGGPSAIVLRLFNVLGPNMPAASLVGAALEALRAARTTGASTIEMGPLEAVRDFVDLRDVAGAVAAACAVPQAGVPIVNVGSGVGHSARELVDALAHRLAYDGTIVERRGGSPRSAGVPWQVADISVARRALGWAPRWEFASTVDWIARRDPRASGLLGGG